MTRLITRHTNRKLYDSASSRYVSLSGIVDLVMAGESVRIVEHPSGHDATPRVLAQALVDLVRRGARSLPASLMETLLRLVGGARLVQSEPPTPLQGITDRARKEAEAIAARLVARGRLGIEEALHLRKEVEAAIHQGALAAEAAARKPLHALRPGREARTIAGLARELKTLNTLVSRPVTPSASPSRIPPSERRRRVAPQTKPFPKPRS
jgi:polyhydroxyalkanoate synthesis repressor PhaR